MSRQVFEARRDTLGVEHPATIYSKNHADGLAEWLGKYACNEPID